MLDRDQKLQWSKMNARRNNVSEGNSDQLLMSSVGIEDITREFLYQHTLS